MPARSTWATVRCARPGSFAVDHSHPRVERVHSALLWHPLIAVREDWIVPVSFESHGSPVSIERIGRFENVLGARLPEDYRRFLLETNGGRPEQNVLPDENVGVDRFFSLGSEEHSLDAVYADHRERIPSGFLPIAGWADGNLFCLSLQEQPPGAVYVWDHEFEAEEGQVFEGTVTRVATSFSAFLQTLQQEGPVQIDDVQADVWLGPDGRW